MFLKNYIHIYLINRTVDIGICCVALMVIFGIGTLSAQSQSSELNRPPVSTSSMDYQPNIILIMADDLGMETLASYGGTQYSTPNLDKLAATGMQFENCYATPLCTPSRVQIMTGKYNFRNYLGFGILDPKEITFGHKLQEAGYKTCVAGKWQLYGNQRQRELVGGRVGTLPQDAGFDNYCLWQVKDRGWRYKSPTIETTENGLETFDGDYGPDKFVEYIETFITENQQGPFFVYYPMCLVHDPFLPTPEGDDFNQYDPKLKLNDTTYFGETMTHMDKQVGRIVKKLDALALSEKTVVLFVGDNGTDRKVVSTWKGQKIKGAKGYTVEAGTHVPFIANWRGTITPGKNQNLIDFTDFFPTLLDVAGDKDNSGEIRDGLSFYSQLIGEKTKTRDWIFCHYAPAWGNFHNKRYVQNTEWKLYESGDFFNFSLDPEEKNSVPIDKLTTQQQQLRAEFLEVLSNMK